MPTTTKTVAPAALLTVNLSKTKETKGAVRYDAPDNEQARIGGPFNVYIRKDSMKDFPQNITITVTNADA